MSLYRINSLVEICSGDLSSNKGDDGIGAAMSRAMGWLEANPGRWFIVGEVTNARGGRTHSTFGMDLSSARRAGLETSVVNNRIYARVPHPDGLPLDNLVTRRNPVRTDPLPRLQADPFEWSISELSNAAETAREWLFPGAYYAAA
jgi:hypothetical protein